MNILKLKTLAIGILFVLCMNTSGCGYILHPERRNSGHSNRLDPTIVTFDCLWLLPGLIPGIVALIVDSVHDTWYYGPGEARKL